MSFKSALLPIATAIVLVTSAAIQAQSSQTTISFGGATAKLGELVVSLPAPEGYEEATQNWESVKLRFAAAVPPEGDLLAGYLPISDCDLLRKNQPALYSWWTIINVYRPARTHVSSKAEFARIVGYAQPESEFWKNRDRSKIKEVLAQTDKLLSKETSKDVKLDLSQPKPLGAFDRRANVYSSLLLLNLTVRVDEKEVASIPVLASMTLLLIKQRVINVFAYKKYESEADADAVMQFTTKWVNEILAAN